MKTMIVDTWAHLNEDTPFNHLFPYGVVPIQSIFPIIPREQGCPECYVVDGKHLTEDQINGLATILLEQWPQECSDFLQAIAYIRDGLPLKKSWFSGCGTANLGVLFTLWDGADEEVKDYELLDEDY